MKKNVLLLCFMLFSTTFLFAENKEEIETYKNVEISICAVPGITQVNYINAKIKIGNSNWGDLYTAHTIPQKCYVSIKVSSPANAVFNLVYGTNSCAWWYSSAGNLDFCADGESGDQIVFKSNITSNSYAFRLE